MAERGNHAPETLATLATLAAPPYESEFSSFGVAPAKVANPANLFGWQRKLSQVDPCQPPEGFSMGLWQNLYDDAVWILENHGAFAAAHGWSVADLFGLWPGKPNSGGIADRLQGSRALVMDGDRASWRCFGTAEQFNRGSYPQLTPFWEALK